MSNSTSVSVRVSTPEIAPSSVAEAVASELAHPLVNFLVTREKFLKYSPALASKARLLAVEIEMQIIQRPKQAQQAKQAPSFPHFYQLKMALETVLLPYKL
jgi:hypothetical protein